MQNEGRETLLKSFSDRLKQAIDQSGFAGLEQGALAAEIGVSRQALRKWLEAKALPSQTRLPMIAGLLGVNLSWLAIGEGVILQNDQLVTDVNVLQSITQEELRFLEKYRALDNMTKQSFDTLFDAVS
jgi:transcriptional regulator with XRE-family HTH domain